MDAELHDEYPFMEQGDTERLYCLACQAVTEHDVSDFIDGQRYQCRVCGEWQR